MITKHFCEKCGQGFDAYGTCLQHEKECQGIFIIKVCAKCGMEDKFSNNDHVSPQMWHKIELGRMGYYNDLDGCDINFDLCDKCLTSWIDTFQLKGDIYGSGANASYDCEEI